MSGVPTGLDALPVIADAALHVAEQASPLALIAAAVLALALRVVGRS